MPVPAPPYIPPSGSQPFSVSKGNNYYVSTTNGTTTITTNNGIPLATTKDGGKTYTYTSEGNKDNNLKSTLANNKSSAYRIVKQNSKIPDPNNANQDNQDNQEQAGTPTTLNIETQVKANTTETLKILGTTNKVIKYPKTLGTSKQDFI